MSTCEAGAVSPKQEHLAEGAASSPAAARASRTCCRSATRPCAGRSSPAAPRWSAPSHTSRTARCSTWSPTSAAPPRPTPASGSYPTSRRRPSGCVRPGTAAAASCSARSNASGPGWTPYAADRRSRHRPPESRLEGRRSRAVRPGPPVHGGRLEAARRPRPRPRRVVALSPWATLDRASRSCRKRTAPSCGRRRGRARHRPADPAGPRHPARHRRLTGPPPSGGGPWDAPNGLCGAVAHGVGSPARRQRG